MTNKKYKVWDEQLHQYAFNESIFDTKQDAIEQLLDYFSVDHNKKELEEIGVMLEQENDFAELVIQEVEDE